MSPSWFASRIEQPLCAPRKRLQPVNLPLLQQSTHDYLCHAVEYSTRRSHEQAWSLWRIFQSHSDVATRPHMPRTAERVALFASWLANSGYKYSTVQQYLAGVGAVYAQYGYHDWDRIRAHPALKRVLVGIEKSWHLQHVQSFPLQDLFTWSEFCTVLVEASKIPSLHDRCLFRAMLVFGFTALHRLAELTAPVNCNHASATAARRISLASIHYVVVPPLTRPSYIEYTLPYHKGDPHSRGTQCRIFDDSIWNGSHHLRHVLEYIRLRREPSTVLPELFLTQALEYPSRRWFLAHLASLASCRHGSKSLRAGGATYAALSNKSPAFIKLLGRWKSDAWLAYVQQWTALRHSLQQ
ncbi:hypothetical protein BDR26DRAFT_964530 [Obelidium mucronatum]|nr:hypothetical protein BDR26DRAFT_964530 [Obelidium mucronatum]